MIDITAIANTALDVVVIGLSIIGGATVAFRGLLELSKYTKTEKDNKFFSAVLKFLEKLSGNVSEMKNVIEVVAKK